MSTAPPARFRDARPEDATAIARVLIRTKEESFPELTDAHDRDFAFWRDRWRRYIEHGATAQFARGDSFTVLVERGEELAAFAAYHHTRRWKCDAELQSIYVLPAEQGRGIGSALLCEVMRRLRADGSQSLCVGYAPENPYKRFYLKHRAVEINPHWAVWRRLPEL